MLVSKTETTMSLSNLTSDSTFLTAASNSVVLFKSWQMETQYSYEAQQAYYMTTVYWNKNKTHKNPCIVALIIPWIRSVNINKAKPRLTHHQSIQGVYESQRKSVRKRNSCLPKVFLFGHHRVTTSRRQTRVDKNIFKYVITWCNHACRNLYCVIFKVSTHFPRASSTSPRLGSSPRTLPLHVSGINSSAGYAWSWKHA